MYTLTISDNTVDELFKDILIQDYRGLESSIAELQNQSDLKSFEQEDLENNLRYLAAMQTMLEYYIGAEWENRI